MALATAMYHTGHNPLRKIEKESDGNVDVVKGETQRRLHKAFLRYHDPDNWPVLRQALLRMGRKDLIGHGKECLVPPERPGQKARMTKRGSTRSRRSG
jgi:radical SAM superfamily enzyme YgiQ (UPF0313 family)